jgi:2-oxoglutarate ferredoxin oxidoreductase subunit alpha
VLAPASVRDCFEIMGMAFDIAETYQIPVIVMSEQALGFRKMALPQALLRDYPRVDVRPVTAKIVDDAKYLRYQITEDGISPRTVPGQRGGAHVATGLEHAEDCKPAYDPPTRTAMMEKRQRKLERILKEHASVLRFGDPKPEIGVIGWGSPAGSIQEAVEAACALGIKAGGLVPRLIFPSPNHLIRPFVEPCKKVIVAEGNMTGQYAAFLRSQIPGLDPLQLNRYDGLPVRPAEVLAKIQEVAS